MMIFFSITLWFHGVHHEHGVHLWHHGVEASAVGKFVRLDNFGVILGEKGVGYITVFSLETNIHEFAHRLQGALPGLQALFKELHTQRTAGDALVSLKKLKPGHGFDSNEFTREDKYIDPYWGKDYDGEPLEVMTMALQTVLAGMSWESGKFFTELYNKDCEMFDFVVGLLFHWKP